MQNNPEEGKPLLSSTLELYNRLASVLLAVLLLTSCDSATAQQDAKAAIRQVLHDQQDRWNAEDLVGFMQGYLQSDSLYFVGSSGVRYGWQNTLRGYQKGYPTKEHLGKLHFTLKHIDLLGEAHALVVGRYLLIRETTIGNASGTFSLVMQKTRKGWKIISDHTSADKVK